MLLLDTIPDNGGNLLDQFTALLADFVDVFLIFAAELLDDLADCLGEFAGLIDDLGANLGDEFLRSIVGAPSLAQEVAGYLQALLVFGTDFLDADRKILV